MARSLFLNWRRARWTACFKHPVPNETVNFAYARRALSCHPNSAEGYVVYSAVSYCAFSKTLLVCVVPPPEAVTVTVYTPDGVPRFIWLLPPRPLAQEVRAKPTKTSTINPSNASQRLLCLGAPSRKTQATTIPAIAAK
jgi:hypothetical protein